MKKLLLVFYSLLKRLFILAYRLSIPNKINKIRKKNQIIVYFILNDISKWKTEYLYKRMLIDPRFKPILGVTLRMGENPSDIARNVQDTIKYLESKSYNYVELSDRITPMPDIILYTEPYDNVPKHQMLYYNWHSLFIYASYSANTALIDVNFNAALHSSCWMECLENQTVLEDVCRYLKKRKKSFVITGLPLADTLLDKPGKDPWKKQKSNKKRIIWAPHHSIGGPQETIVYGNFLKIADFMLELSEKYKDTVQFAFKPHPLLRWKLEMIWGNERTDKYYKKWETGENTQLSTGVYTDLFKYSDAMIHDSSSFLVEYLYMNNPTLFIVGDEQSILKDLNRFGKGAYYSHELAYKKDDIEAFIQSVLNNIDAKKSKRQEFVNTQMLPPNNMSASDNIINLIKNADNKNT